MKPLDLKIEHFRRLGYGVERRGEWLYIWGEVLDRWGYRAKEKMHVLVLHGNPTYRCIRESIRKHLHSKRNWSRL